MDRRFREKDVTSSHQFVQQGIDIEDDAAKKIQVIGKNDDDDGHDPASLLTALNSSFLHVMQSFFVRLLLLECDIFCSTCTEGSISLRSTWRELRVKRNRCAENWKEIAKNCQQSIRVAGRRVYTWIASFSFFSSKYEENASRVKRGKIQCNWRGISFTPVLLPSLASWSFTKRKVSLTRDYMLMPWARLGTKLWKMIASRMYDRGRKELQKLPSISPDKL